MEAVYDILLKDARYLTPDMEVARGDVAMADGRIAAILPAGSGAAAGRTLSGEGLLWMPGLVDGHTHTSQQLLRGRLLDEKPVIWKRVNVPFECRLDEDSSRLSAQLAALEMIHSGTTGFIDAGGKYAEVFAQVYEASGLRGRLTCFTNDNAPEPLNCRTAEEGVRRLKELCGSLSGRLQGYFSVTALTAASEELFRTVLEAAAEVGAPVEIHMNEYASEVSEFIERYGSRPFEYLEAHGLLKAPFIAPHCIFLSAGEMEIIRQRQVRVIHCPFSNCGKGVPDTPQLFSRGISVGFGSDGSAHGGLDLFREMRLFRGVQNAVRDVHTADSQVMPAKALLKMATQGGAAAMMEEGGGRIAPGAPADLIALDIAQPHLWPTQDLVNTLVESASGRDVVHMIVDGRLVMEDRQVLTMDEQAILAQARALLDRQPHLARWA